MNIKTPEELRTFFIKVRVNAAELKEITETAAGCGKPPSTFLRERGLGYKPKYHLTEKEFTLLEAVQKLLVELQRFTSVISGKAKGIKDQSARMSFLFDLGILKPWKKKLDVVIDFLYATLSNVQFRHAYNYDR